MLQEKIEEVKEEIGEQKAELSKIVQRYGFGTMKEFYYKYDNVSGEKKRYELELRKWEDKNVPEKLPVSVVESLRRNRKYKNKFISPNIRDGRER